LFPFSIMLIRSFMTNVEVMNLPVKFFPEVFSMDAYRQALDANLIRYFGNTIFVVVLNIIAVTLSSSLCAYGFSKLEFAGREFLFSLVLATIMLPAITVQIPLYALYSELGWLNTLNPLVVPAFFGGGAMNIFLLRQFMKGIPNDLCNAASIDGASALTIFFRIIFPLCKPVVILVAVNTFLGVWNDFMGPLMYLKTEKFYTIAVGVYIKFIGTISPQNLPNVQLATGIMLSIPPAVIFFIFQKQLIDGVVMTGIKG